MEQERTKLSFTYPGIRRPTHLYFWFLMGGLAMAIVGRSQLAGLGHLYVFAPMALMAFSLRTKADVIITCDSIRNGEKEVRWDEVTQVNLANAITGELDHLSIKPLDPKKSLQVDASFPQFAEVAAWAFAMASADLERRRTLLQGPAPATNSIPRFWQRENGLGKTVRAAELKRGKSRIHYARFAPLFLAVAMAIPALAAGLRPGGAEKYRVAAVGLTLFVYACGILRTLAFRPIVFVLETGRLTVSDHTGTTAYGPEDLAATSDFWGVVTIRTPDRSLVLWGPAGGDQIGDWILSMRIEAGLEEKVVEPSALAPV